MTPELSVVVASHDRPLRLRWLLNALEEQTLGRDRWEVVVAHDSRGPETEALLRDHPLTEAGVLRHVRVTGGTASPGANRNAAWPLAGAALIVFTDDDCRPPAPWLANMLEAARRHPGAIVQGATTPDPDELGLTRLNGWRSQQIVPPVPWAQACNILYPREALDATGGFDAAMRTGEDTDLAQRAIAAGYAYEAAPEALTHHAVEVVGLAARVAASQRWGDVALNVRRHPHLRRLLPLRIFWKPRHAWLGPALLGAALARRHPLLALLLVGPWARAAVPSYGPGPRGRTRAVAELPVCLVEDVAETVAMVRGSVRHRSLLL